MTSPCKPSRKNETPDPCIRQCCLDERDVCVGCGRSLAVILRWHRMSDAERKRWLAEHHEHRI